MLPSYVSDPSDFINLLKANRERDVLSALNIKQKMSLNQYMLVLTFSFIMKKFWLKIFSKFDYSFFQQIKVKMAPIVAVISEVTNLWL